MVAEARGPRREPRTTSSTEFDETFGYFASDQISVRVDDVVGDRPDHGGAAGAASVARSASVAVDRIDDLLDGVDDLPPGDVLRLWLDDGSRVIVRPSGTEPKLKLYLDVRGDSADDAPARIGALGAGARALLDAARLTSTGACREAPC